MKRKYILDSNAVTDLFNQRRGVDRRVVEAITQGAAVGTGLPVGELYQGAEQSSSRNRNLLLLKVSLPTIRLWPYDRARRKNSAASSRN